MYILKKIFQKVVIKDFTSSVSHFLENVSERVLATI